MIPPRAKGHVQVTVPRGALQTCRRPPLVLLRTMGLVWSLGYMQGTCKDGSGCTVWASLTVWKPFTAGLTDAPSSPE